MKKAMALILGVCMLMSTFTACGAKEKASSSDSSESAVSGEQNEQSGQKKPLRWAIKASESGDRKSVV